MSKLRLPAVLILALSMLYSCNAPVSEESDSSIEIDVNETQTAQLSKDFRVARSIILDTAGVILGRISSIIPDQNRLLVHTLSGGNGVFIFDLVGKYIGQFGKQGDGPGEYGYIQDIVITEEAAFVLDGKHKRIDQYSLNGSFQKTLASKVYGLNMTSVGNELVVYAGNSYLENEGAAKKLLFYSFEGDFTRSEQPIDPNHAEFLNFLTQSVFTDKGGFYLEPFMPMIHQIQNGKIGPWKSLDFGKAGFPESALDKKYGNVADFMQQIRQKDYAIFYSNLRATDDWLSFTYQYKVPLAPRWVLVNKASGASVSYDKMIEDVFTDGAVLSMRQMALVGAGPEHFIFTVAPQELLDAQKTINNPAITEDGNPIVYFISKK